MVVSVALSASIANQTLVLATRQQCKSNSTMVPRMLIMIPQPVHILIPPLTIPNTARKRPEALLSFPLHLAELALRDVHRRQIEVVIRTEELRVKRRRQPANRSGLVGPRMGIRPRDTPSSLAFPPLPLQQILDMLQILRRRKVAAAMRHMVLQPIRLLVTLVAIRLGAPERLGQEERRRRPETRR